MSELINLEEEWQRKHDKMVAQMLGEFYAKVDKLQKECKHEKTHWIQELNKDGSFKGMLVKRCFVCGANIEKLDTTEIQLEMFLNNFDADVERYKISFVEKVGSEKE